MPRCALASALVLACTLARVARADWPAVPMVLDSAQINGMVPTVFASLSDDAGGAYLAAGRGNLHTSRFDAGGGLYPGFPIDVAHGQSISDGLSGVITVFADANADIRASHRRPDGTADPAWPAGDVLVCGATGSQTGPHVCSDGAGGAFVVWKDARVAQWQLYVNHVFASGTVSFTNGVPLGPISDIDPSAYTVVPDGAGGALVAWTTHVQHVTSVLGSLWAAGGTVLPGILAYGHRFVADGAGGAFVSWDDGSQALLWKLDAAGNIAAGWSATPFAPGGGARDPVIVNDDAGGVFFAWAGGGGARALRVSSDGSAAAGWPAAGLDLSSGAAASQVALLADAEGGAIAAIAAGTSLIANHLTPAGTFVSGWSAGGHVLRSGVSQAQGPTLAAVAGGAVVAWWERHTAVPFGYHDDIVFALRFGGDATVSTPPASPPDGLVLGPVRPNPARGAFSASLALPRDQPAAVDLLDVGGRSVQTLALRGRGRHEITLGNHGELAPGLYFIRIRQGSALRTARVVIAR